MKQFLQSVVLTIGLLILCTAIYPLIMLGIAQVMPNHGKGFVVKDASGNLYFENIGQKFVSEKYFHGRPSAVDYDAAGSGGSNKGPNDPDYLSDVKTRVADLQKDCHNHDGNLPVELVTASGSGLDPHLSLNGAMVQVERVAAARNLPVETIRNLVKKSVEKNFLGPDVINVLKLNIALDNLSK